MLLASEGLSASKFAETVGVQASGISHILSGRNKPGYDLIVKILGNFPDISPDWLLLGEGSMYRDGRTKACCIAELDRTDVIEEHNIDEPTLFDVVSRHNNSFQPHSDENTGRNTAASNHQPMSTPDDQTQDIASLHSAAGTTTGSLTQAEGIFNNCQTTEVKIELVMIFYSDNTVSTYNLKR